MNRKTDNKRPDPHLSLYKITFLSDAEESFKKPNGTEKLIIKDLTPYVIKDLTPYVIKDLTPYVLTPYIHICPYVLLPSVYSKDPLKTGDWARVKKPLETNMI